MLILGLNAFHGDSAAALIVNGKLLAAAEEERFRRIKHWADLPTEAIRYCLEVAGINIADIDHIAVNHYPEEKISGVRAQLARSLGVAPNSIRAQVDNIEHHLAHLGGAFFVSPFSTAAVVSIAGCGNFASTAWGVGCKNRITVFDRTCFPHSLGLFYLAITQYLGFPNYGDEYKVMGLAAYGKTTELDKLRQIVRLLPQGRFELDLSYFDHHCAPVSMFLGQGAPGCGKVYATALEHLLGPARSTEQPLDQYHCNIAASAQAMYEEAFFHLLQHVQKQSGLTTLALAGGCAMNSVANGKIMQNTKFRDLYIPPAAGDAGAAIGAAFMVWNQELGQQRSFVLQHAYWGPEFSGGEISALLQQNKSQLEAQSCVITLVQDWATLCRQTAAAIAAGKVVGWFQGRMEWGPRALGNRSILGDPRRADMQDILNLKIKRRESFRPFAPSILREHVPDWFETDYDVPFMQQVFQIREGRRAEIPAVTHVNGSGRLQTVSEEQNYRYYRLIQAFYDLSGVPMLLNTSFNENEPVVCRPQEALNCFLRTEMDALVLGDYLIERPRTQAQV